MSKRTALILYKTLSVLIYLIVSIGTGIFLYPYFRSAVANIRQVVQIDSYEVANTEKALEDIAREKAEALQYNADIAAKQKDKPFSYQGADITDEKYDSLLSGKDGQMCIVDIPGIDVHLPVMHGTGEDELETAAGHMYGTSLPIGGSSSHCVITGHTGLATAELLTDLNKVKVGDEIRVTVLNEIHRYKVYEINVVLPEVADYYLQVEDGKDLLTLYTCTPYGINDHRLLVHAEREYPDMEVSKEMQKKSVSALNREAYAKAIILAIVPFAIMTFGLWMTFRRKKKG